MIFEKLKARDPIAASSIGDLEAEHREGARRLRRAAQAVERVLSDQDLLRQTVAEIIRDFIKHERQHMAMEERVVFPAALNVLRPEDWSDIALKMADRDDPFYRPDFEQKFNRLRRNIREMEEEADLERASDSVSALAAKIFARAVRLRKPSCVPSNSGSSTVMGNVNRGNPRARPPGSPTKPKHFSAL